MTLRARMALVAGAAVAVVAVVVTVTAYVADRSELRGQVDRSLAATVRPFVYERDRPGPGFGLGPPPDGGSPYGPPPRAAFGGAPGYVQFVSPDGTVSRFAGEARPLPVDSQVLSVAQGSSGQFFTDTTVDGVHLRVLTAPDADGGAVQVARPLSEVDHVLSRLLLIAVIVGAAGIALAALVGAFVARAALAPIVRFTRRTEDVTSSNAPTQRLEIEGRDELARLARSFNTTLDALERSVESQRHLVADASHELRTPIASLRANVQVLAEADRLPPDERERLRADIIEELDALTELVGDVVELARGSAPPSVTDDVSLDELVVAAAERARARAPEVTVALDVERTVVHGVPDRISRAVVNVLDNAVKWSPPGSAVEVSLRGGVLSVRDHGPGFVEADLPHVFDRFYRADAARGLPGSGLGLALVRQAADAHGGFARASNAPDGGAVIEVSFGAPTDAGAEPHAVATEHAGSA